MDPQIAIQIAQANWNLKLTDAHWQWLNALVFFVATYGITPNEKALIQWMKSEGMKVSGLDLAILFPSPSLKNACLMAQIDPPDSCL